MTRLRLSSLLFALLAGASLSATANQAPPAEPVGQPAVQAQVQPAQPAPAVVPEAGRVPLNSADAQTLARELNGIGPAKAQAIVAYRDSQGPFASVDELLEVKGIGPAILEKNRERLSLD